MYRIKSKGIKYEKKECRNICIYKNVQARYDNKENQHQNFKNSLL